MNRTIKFTKISLLLIFLAYALVILQYPAFILLGYGGFVVGMLAKEILPLAQILSILLFVVTLVSWKNTSKHFLPSVPLLLLILGVGLILVSNYVANAYGMYSLAMGIEEYSGFAYFVIMLIVVIRYNKFAKQNLAPIIETPVRTP